MPAITEFFGDQLDAIGCGAAQLELPVPTRLVRPELHETFWVR